MMRPYQCLGIVAEAQQEVNGTWWRNRPAPEITEQAPASAFLGELFVKQDLPTWAWAGEVRESLCALPKDKADDLLAIWRLAIERSSTPGDGR